MVNHLRTLLLNRDGRLQPADPDFPIEYVPPDFRPISWTGALAEIRNVLLPPGCDEGFADLRMRQLMQLLHGAGYGSEVRKWDSRITYLGPRPTGVRPASVRVEPLSDGPAGASLTATGSPEMPETIRMRAVWRVTAAAGRLTARAADGREAVSSPFSAASGAETGLPGHPALAVFLSAGTFPDGAVWRVTSRLRPASEPTDLVSRLESGHGNAVASVFSGAGRDRWRALWREHPSPGHRLAALLIAWGLGAEEVRLGR